MAEKRCNYGINKTKIMATDIIVPESSAAAGEVTYQAMKVKFGQSIYAKKGSFVVVSKVSFEENLNIVPTMQEAFDFVEMEEIERQLDF